MVCQSQYVITPDLWNQTSCQLPMGQTVSALHQSGGIPSTPCPAHEEDHISDASDKELPRPSQCRKQSNPGVT